MMRNNTLIALRNQGTWILFLMCKPCDYGGEYHKKCSWSEHPELPTLQCFNHSK